MMKNKIFAIALIFLCLKNTTAFAKELTILTTIRPIYGLVKAVSGDKNQIEILVDQNQSPHEYNMKPSDIVKIKSANLIFMIDDSFEFSLASYLKKKLPKNKVIKFSQNPQIILLKNRENFELLNDNESDHSHSHDSHHHHSHDSDDYDMHFWLDPDNAQIMIKEIANTLSDADPENSKFYQANAIKFNNELKALDSKLKNIFIKHNEPFIVLHDAYQYFSKRYHLQNVGVVIVNHNVTPGIKTIQELQNIIEENNVKCIFAEPQFSSRIVRKIAEETNINVGIIDAEYGEVNLKENAYIALLNNMAESMSKCFNQK